MVNTYTTKLNLAKPANGDVNWHIPVNGNWDKIDTELDKALKISGTTIDANKDWNGKAITNLGYIESSRIRPAASDQIRHGPVSGPMTVTIPAVYGPGTAKVTSLVGYYWSGEHGYPGYMVIKVNSVTVATVTAPNVDNNTLTQVISVQGGDVVNVTGKILISASLSLDDTPPVWYPPAPTWPE